MINHLFAHVIHSVWLVGRRKVKWHLQWEVPNTRTDVSNLKTKLRVKTCSCDVRSCEHATECRLRSIELHAVTHATRANVTKHKKHSEQKRSWLDLSNTCDQGSSMRRLLLLWLCRCWLCSRQRSRGRSRLVSPSRVHLYLSGKCDGEGSSANPTAGVALEASLALQRKDYVPASFTSIRLPYISSLFLLVLKILY